MRSFIRIVALAVALVIPGSAFAQQYPSKPVKIIVPFPPAGVTDIVGRLVAQKLSEKLGEQFYIENIAGAGGNLGMGQAARSPGDGYTILFASSSIVVNPTLYSKVPFDIDKDFVPVTKAGATPNSWQINPNFPASTMAALIDIIRKEPGKYSVASPGTGTTPSLSIEMLRLALGLNFVVARDYCQQTRRVRARDSDARRTGHSESRGRDHDRRIRADGYAEADRRPASEGNLHDGDHARDQGAAPGAWRSAGRGEFGPVRGLREGRSGKMEKGHHRGKSPADRRVTAVTRLIGLTQALCWSPLSRFSSPAGLVGPRQTFARQRQCERAARKAFWKTTQAMPLQSCQARSAAHFPPGGHGRRGSGFGKER